jgi:hypothetical protein
MSEKELTKPPKKTVKFSTPKWKIVTREFQEKQKFIRSNMSSSKENYTNFQVNYCPIPENNFPHFPTNIFTCQLGINYSLEQMLKLCQIP